jgi:hypothetical protein
MKIKKALQENKIIDKNHLIFNNFLSIRRNKKLSKMIME